MIGAVPLSPSWPGEPGPPGNPFLPAAPGSPRGPSLPVAPGSPGAPGLLLRCPALGIWVSSVSTRNIWAADRGGGVTGPLPRRRPGDPALRGLTADQLLAHLAGDGAHHVLRGEVALRTERGRSHAPHYYISQEHLRLRGTHPLPLVPLRTQAALKTQNYGSVVMATGSDSVAMTTSHSQGYRSLRGSRSSLSRRVLREILEVPEDTEGRTVRNLQTDRLQLLEQGTEMSTAVTTTRTSPWAPWGLWAPTTRASLEGPGSTRSRLRT